MAWHSLIPNARGLPIQTKCQKRNGGGGCGSYAQQSLSSRPAIRCARGRRLKLSVVVVGCAPRTINNIGIYEGAQCYLTTRLNVLYYQLNDLARIGCAEERSASFRVSRLMRLLRRHILCGLPDFNFSEKKSDPKRPV